VVEFGACFLVLMVEFVVAYMSRDVGVSFSGVLRVVEFVSVHVLGCGCLESMLEGSVELVSVAHYGVMYFIGLGCMARCGGAFVGRECWAFAGVHVSGWGVLLEESVGFSCMSVV